LFDCGVGLENLSPEFKPEINIIITVIIIIIIIITELVQ